MAQTISALPLTGGRRHRVTVKKMKKVLKKAGLKVTGKRATLTRRIKKAHLKVRGGGDGDGDDTAPETAPAPAPAPAAASGDDETTDGGRRRSRKGKKGSRRH